MISFFKVWCEGIIVAVVISIIIESLLPEGNNKKYVKVIIGIYIVFVILRPIIPNLNKELKLDDFFSYKSIQTVDNIDDNIKSIYIKGMEESLKEEIENLGFSVIKISISVDEYYENINKIEVILSKQKIESVEPIIIENQNSFKKLDNYIELKQFISNNYDVNTDKIIIRLYE